jgi:hypothetical protein
VVSSARQRYRVAMSSVLGTLCGLLPGRFIVGSAHEPVDGLRMELSCYCAPVDCSHAVVETIFVQPAVESDTVEARVIGEVRPAGEWFCVRIANLGKDADAAVVPWDVSRYTGFEPEASELRASYQRGPGDLVGGTAVQMRATEIGIWIDSDHPRPRQGSLIPVCPGYWWWDVTKAPRPFQRPDLELSFSLDMKVPTAQREGNAEVYVCAYLLLRDQRSGRQFWLGPSLFDLRNAERFPDTVHFDDWEGGTKLPILFSALNERSAWFRPGLGSACYTDRPFAEYRRFEFRVGHTELRAAIAALKQRWPEWEDLSEDPADFQLTHFNVNPEVHAPIGSRGRLGLAMRDIRLVLVSKNPCCN